MAEPTQRLTSTRSGNRRSHLALKEQKLGTCPQCKEPVQSHRVCPTCGTYKGVQVINVNKDKRIK